MEKTGEIITILRSAVAFCFVLVSLAQAGQNEPITKGWADKNKGINIPIWEITQDGTSKSVKWVDHATNPRFAIYDPGTTHSPSDDLVFDKETGLVWARDAYLLGDLLDWKEAINCCRNVRLGNRKGWRLPTVEELSSLIDFRESDPALPSGHPFINVRCDIFGQYWSSTSCEGRSDYTWYVDMGTGGVGTWPKTDSCCVWPVRGGNGYATGNW